MSKLFSFGIISDVQYASVPSEAGDEKPAPLSIAKLKSALQELNQYDLEFTVSLGDLIDRDSRNFDPLLKVFKDSKSPVWHVLGNHDFANEKYEYGFRKEAFEALGFENNGYYYRDLNGFRFIILDTNELGVIEFAEGSKEWQEGQKYIQELKDSGAINADEWNGGVSKQQLNWLSKTIDSANDEGLNCILFAHHPIFPVTRLNCINFEEITELISSKPNVKAFINGHNHDGNYGEVNGIACWTVEAMMDFVDQTAYAVADVYEDRLEITGFGRVENRIIKFS